MDRAKGVRCALWIFDLPVDGLSSCRVTMWWCWGFDGRLLRDRNLKYLFKRLSEPADRIRFFVYVWCMWVLIAWIIWTGDTFRESGCDAWCMWFSLNELWTRCINFLVWLNTPIQIIYNKILIRFIRSALGDLAAWSKVVAAHVSRCINTWHRLWKEYIFVGVGTFRFVSRRRKGTGRCWHARGFIVCRLRACSSTPEVGVILG